MLLVGLTGGIASGKSLVAETFSQLGAVVIDADKISHRLIEPGKIGYQKVIDCFGREVLNEDCTINRTKLARIVFADAGARKKLEGILHPQIIEQVKEEIAEIKSSRANSLVIVDGALLIETGSQSLVDKLIVVTENPEVQVERLMKRDGLTRDEAEARISAQLPLKEKVKFADYVIDNEGKRERTRSQTQEVWRRLTNLCKKVRPAEGDSDNKKDCGEKSMPSSFESP